MPDDPPLPPYRPEQQLPLRRPSPPPLPPPLPTPGPLSGRARPATSPTTLGSVPTLRPRGRPGPILAPEELDRFKDLLVFARATVEGFFSGRHKSPYRGSSAEFADYKVYVAGDDVAQLDWRVYGRSRRLFLRQFEDETDLTAYLLVDASASMTYAGGGRQAKFYLAAKIAAALAYLMLNQGDKASLTLFADTVQQFIPPGGTRRHLHRMVTALEQAQPASTTGMAHALTECHALFKKRGRLIVVSDFLTDQAALFDALGQFLHRRFEILLLHVVDRDELNLPPLTAARFVDLETKEEIEVETEEIRAGYRARVKQSLSELAQGADMRAISHALVHTDRPYLEAIEAYLGFRGRGTLLTE